MADQSNLNSVSKSTGGNNEIIETNDESHNEDLAELSQNDEAQQLNISKDLSDSLRNIISAITSDGSNLNIHFDVKKIVYVNSPNQQPATTLTNENVSADSSNASASSSPAEKSKRRAEALEDEPAAKSSRYVAAMEKRQSAMRQTVDGRPTKDCLPATVKNTNKDVHVTNNMYTMLCVLCNKFDRHLVSHYLKMHQEAEVFISRPSPAMAQLIREQSSKFTLDGNKIRGMCYFCEEEKTFAKAYWAQHMLTHTGELPFSCAKCGKSLPRKQVHDDCDSFDIRSILDIRGRYGNCVIGYMCKLCNYLQLAETKLSLHITNQHEKINDDAAQYYEKVFLVHDPSVANVYKRISESDEKKFAIVEENKKNIAKVAHEECTSFSCPCCYTNVLNEDNNNSESGIAEHIIFHGIDIYRCDICSHQSHSEVLMLEHFWAKHPVREMKIQLIYRSENGNDVLTKEMVFVAKCDLCDVHLDSLQTISTHFATTHNQQYINISIFEKTDENGNNNTNGQSVWFLRPLFECVACAYTSQTIADAMTHHYESHTGTFQANLTKRKWLPKANVVDPTRFTAENRRINHFVYCCAHCHTTSGTIFYPNVRDVYAHWLTRHATSESVLPFRYHVTSIVTCHYCDVTATAFDMMEHHKLVHASRPLIIADQWDSQRCGLCKFRTEDMVKHFANKHNGFENIVDSISPISLEDDLLDNLLTSNILGGCEMSVGHAERTADVSFPTPSTSFGAGSIENIKPTLVQWTCCNTTVDSTNCLEHMEYHDYRFECTICVTAFDNLKEAAHHDRNNHRQDDGFKSRKQDFISTLLRQYYNAKVIFDNGLMLTKRSLISTRLSDRQAGEQMVEKITSQQKYLFGVNI